jgi:hypothetical protein
MKYVKKIMHTAPKHYTQTMRRIKWWRWWHDSNVADVEDGPAHSKEVSMARQKDLPSPTEGEDF